MDELSTRRGRLSLRVKPHPALEGRDGELVYGTLKISGDFQVHQDLHTGDRVTVHVADADGTVIAQGEAEIGAPTFKVLKSKDVYLGMQRGHKATLTD